MKVYYDNQPSIVEGVGNGSYRYHWNIKQININNEEGEEKTAWECDEVIVWGTISSDKIINAIIHTKYSTDQELSLVNKFNAYQQGLSIAPDVINNYKEYLLFVDEIKHMVKKDLGEDIPIIKEAGITPRLVDVFNAITMAINTFQISDNDALKIKSIYPLWDDFIGQTVKKDIKLQYDGKLWKVLQEHLVQEQFKPGNGTESLYTEISEEHIGSLEDPIPYNGNMILELNKYYIQENKIYKCIRNTEIPIYNPLADVIGIYVELVK